jgi:hypothetical protein
MRLAGGLAVRVLGLAALPVLRATLAETRRRS